ncbi:peptidase M4 family protein, partial [Streptomyces sp. ZG43]
MTDNQRPKRTPTVRTASDSALIRPAPHPVFCTIVPPHVLDHLSHLDDPVLSVPARRTLERHARERTRRLSAVAATR